MFRIPSSRKYFSLRNPQYTNIYIQMWSIKQTCKHQRKFPLKEAFWLLLFYYETFQLNVEASQLKHWAYILTPHWVCCCNMKCFSKTLNQATEHSNIEHKFWLRVDVTHAGCFSCFLHWMLRTNHRYITELCRKRKAQLLLCRRTSKRVSRCNRKNVKLDLKVCQENNFSVTKCNLGKSPF